MLPETEELCGQKYSLDKRVAALTLVTLQSRQWSLRAHLALKTQLAPEADHRHCLAVMAAKSEKSSRSQSLKSTGVDIS